MGEQVTTEFSCDKQLREDCSAIYSALGMDLNAALRLFMERTREVRGLPFSAAPPRKTISPAEALDNFNRMREEASDVPEMTLEEINEEIRQAREARKARM